MLEDGYDLFDDLASATGLKLQPENKRGMEASSREPATRKTPSWGAHPIWLIIVN